MKPDIVYHPEYFKRSCNYFNWLRNEIQWQQEHITIYGKVHKLPRLTAWYGENSYVYSGIKHIALSWIPILNEIRSELSLLGYSFNSLLLNLYRDGKDSVSWHSDDEPNMDSTIASVSFGAMRKFQMKHKQTGERFDLDLADGDLLIMQGDTQKEWVHSIPKTSKKVGERINLTFRNIK